MMAPVPVMLSVPQGHLSVASIFKDDLHSFAALDEISAERVHCVARL